MHYVHIHIFFFFQSITWDLQDDSDEDKEESTDVGKEKASYEDAWKKFSEEDYEEEKNNISGGDQTTNDNNNDDYYYYEEDENYQYEYPEEEELSPEDTIPPELMHVELFQHKIIPTRPPKTATKKNKRLKDEVDEDEENKPSYNDVYPKDSPYTSASSEKLIMSKSALVLLLVVILNIFKIR